MKNLIRDLRLEIARFNTFIIENYLLHDETSEDNTEPVRYFHDVFHKLSTGLGDFGGTIEQLDFPLIQNRILHLLKNLISESVLTVFLIEKSTDLENIIFNIRSAKSDQIAITIDNIQKYGALFKKDDVEIEAEINQFKSEYPDFFDFNGQLKYPRVKLSVEEAYQYLIDNTQLPDLRSKFIRAFEDQNFVTQQQLAEIKASSTKAGNSDNNYEDLLIKVVSCLVIVLLACSYAEPFFKRSNQISDAFAKHISKLTFLLTQITNSKT